MLFQFKEKCKTSFYMDYVNYQTDENGIFDAGEDKKFIGFLNNNSNYTEVKMKPVEPAKPIEKAVPVEPKVVKTDVKST